MSLLPSVSVRLCALVVLAFTASVASAETVTFEIKDYDNLNAPTGNVREFLRGYEDYFLDECDMVNMYFGYAYGRYYLRFGNPNSKTDAGTLTLHLTDEFSRAIIKSVTLNASAADDFQKSAYVWVNGVQSEELLSQDVSRATCLLDCAVGNKLEIRISYKAIGSSNYASYDADELTIEYEYAAPATTVEIDPADGIDGLAVGTSVTLKGCCVEDGFVRAILGSDPEEGTSQPRIVTFPVIWATAAEPTTGVSADIEGEIVEDGGVKKIEITSCAESSVPPMPLTAPVVVINGEVATRDLRSIPADARVEFLHPYGDNVEIYYTKRRDVEIDIVSATTDPALLPPSQSDSAARHSAARAADTVDETGTYRYAGSFRPVHASNLSTAEQSNLALKYVAVPGGTLAAAPLWDKSEESVFGHGMISTFAADLEAADDSPAVYYNLQGVRVLSPVAGGLYIRVANGSATIIAK